ncbi:MAG: hypothetical protein OEO79_07940 [Gemmatimonadota bacterium]|nr:hypothetical protein [Gemmatimonadota bacterium]
MEPTEVRALRRFAWLALPLLVVGLAACVRPGPRSEGAAEASWGGRDEAELNGTCVYSVSTKWAATLNHSVQWEDADSEYRVVVSSSRRMGVGSVDLQPEGGQRDPLVLVMDGNTSRGAVWGILETAEVDDLTVHRISGTKVYQDTVPFQAECRLGPLRAGS